MCQVLQRFRRFIKKGQIDKNYDPMSLKNRVHMVLRGYADLTENELASQKDLSEMNQISMEMT